MAFGRTLFLLKDGRREVNEEGEKWWWGELRMKMVKGGGEENEEMVKGE